MTTRKTAKPNAKKATKPKSKEQVTAKPTEGYAGHKTGRRKGKVHELFDTQGAEAAWTLGLRLGLKETTLRGWLATWRRLSKSKVNEVKIAA